MIKKRRVAVPQQTREQMHLECGLRCPIPACTHEDGLDLHHIDGDPSNNSNENLLVLCAVHHRMATEGKLTMNMCRSIKGWLAETRFLFKRTRRLENRSAYLEAAIDELQKTEFTYRSIYVGPLFLHPLWYHKLRDARFGTPNYDVVVAEYLKNISKARSEQTRIILRNSPRYVEKVKELVPSGMLAKLRDDILAAIETLWGRDASKGPLICCMDTGILRIPLIHDKSCVIAVRSAVLSPINSGYLLTNKDDVEAEREMYDTLFDESTRGRRIEVSTLATYIDGLWRQ